MPCNYFEPDFVVKSVDFVKILFKIEPHAEFISKERFDEYKKKILPMRNEIY